MIAWYWCALIAFVVFWIGWAVCAALSLVKVANAEALANQWRAAAVKTQRALELARPILDAARKRAQKRVEGHLEDIPTGRYISPWNDCEDGDTTAAGGMEVGPRD